jgi:predicted ABC-type transport system involved in lysophospholipase L1 biosynthesis ATPase subunit
VVTHSDTLARRAGRLLRMRDGRIEEDTGRAAAPGG